MTFHSLIRPLVTAIAFTCVMSLLLPDSAFGQQNVNVQGTARSFRDGKPLSGVKVSIWSQSDGKSKVITVAGDGVFSFEVEKQPSILIFAKFGSRLVSVDGLSAHIDQMVHVAVPDHGFESEELGRIELVAWERLIKVRDDEGAEGAAGSLFTPEEARERLRKLQGLMGPSSAFGKVAEDLISRFR